VPALQSEEALVLRILEEAHVLVHPGYFFDFEREAYLVVSLLPDPDGFAEALDRLLPIAAGRTRT
jgi:aspartate/methionine/tyrosine aminotransferase